jgi:hypothetical protein
MAILINDTTPRIQYTATSGQTVFTVPFEFFENADLKVYKNSTLLTITTNYTVTGAGVTGGGSVTLTSGATAGDVITIFRDIAVKRVTDFPTSGPFNISALNNDLDRIVAMVQEREDEITRVVQLSDTDSSASLQLPPVATRASKVLGFDSTGNTIAMQEIGNYRGNWASGTAYVLRDLIKDTTNANIYICVAAHTSSGSLPITTNANAAAWALLVDAATATSSSSAAASSASAAASSASAAAGSASAASTSASNAATSASNAATSATNASNSASTASTQATNAANSASSASTSATNAANSATSASGSASTATTQASNASSSATSAASSASTATTQASNAASSASAASTSASNAATSASNAATSASNASSSATAAAAAQSAAETARDQTLTAFDNFDDRYLGTKTGDPTLDNDGNALVAGALYFDSTSGVMKVYTGSAWVAAYVSGSGFLATSGGTITGNLVVNSNSASDGVRITQTGAGNALVVEDSANPDATPFVVDASGNVGIGTSSLTGYNLRISKSLTGAATSRALLVQPTVQSDVTAGAYTFQSIATTNAASFTLPALFHYAADQGTFGAGSTVTNQYGFFSSSGLISATTNFAFLAENTAAITAGKTSYGFYSAVNTATGGGTTWGFYAAGTAANYFAGQVQLGAGTAAAPALSTTGDTNTGIFFPAADTVAISTDGTEDFRIGPAGQIGLQGANYGTSGQVLTSNGSAAAPSWQTASSTGALKNVRVFTSSGTYTRTSGVTTAVVIAVGGGGGGGGSTINGGTGGTTSFGSHVTAVGGSGGTVATGGSPGDGGTGGTGATIAIKGAPGGYSYSDGGCVNFGGIGGGPGGGKSATAGVRGAGGGGNGGVFRGPGGGQGETGIKYTTTVGATETVTIGAGGTAGAGAAAGGAGYIIVYEYS